MKTNKYAIVLILLAICLTGCMVPEVVVQPDGSSTTNLVVDPRITQGLETAKSINTMTAPMNPYSSVISTLLGLATTVTTAWGAIATFFARRKGKLLTTVIQGVEKAGEAAAPVKASIQAHSEKAGVSLQLDPVVQRVVSGG